MKNKPLLFVIILCVLNIFLYSYVFSISPKEASSVYLKVSYLDIGQGDAIYIEAPNGNQMIIDGGPNQNLMNALSEVMPFGDRTIDVIVVTNPDSDHYSGFIPLLENYEVYSVVEPGTTSDTGMYKTLQEKIKEEGAPHVLAEAGTKIYLDKDKDIYFEILFPDRDVSLWSSNDGSVVGKLVYNENSFLFTGDATLLTEGLVVSGYDLSDVDILKVGHHGSKTSTGVPLLRETRPELAIISAGKNNRYGHPNKEVLDRLGLYDIPFLVTSSEGTITLLSDGKNIVRD